MSVNYEITGTIHEIFPVQEVTSKFRKQEVVVMTTDDKYQQFIKLEFVNDKCELVEQLAKEQEVKITFNIQGKPYTNNEGKTIYFTSLRAWKAR
jgi:hypothetical protein